MTITEAAEHGYRELLIALRDHIARAIDDGCSPRDLVGLSKRVVDLSREVQEIDLRGVPMRLVEDGDFDPSLV